MGTASVDSKGHARSVHRRAMLWSLVLILVGAMVAPLSGYVYVAYAQEEGATQVNPRGETWRAVRQGNEGYTSASGPYVTNNLIGNGGENWRNLRNGPVASYMAWLLAIALLGIALFFMLVGRNRLDKPLSGRKVLRWRGWERALHWFTAISFILMAITGLSLLYGRAVLIPLLGHPGFAVWAAFAKDLHNFLGPLFTVGVLLIIVSFIKYNIPNRTDIEWFRKGGGMGKQHASAGRMNGGEKVWFWFIVVGGGLVCITGLILDFPGFGQTREVMQWSNLIHAVVGIAWIALAFGHIYIGTLGTEGAFQGMATGYVSEEWARAHHDLWFEDVQRTGSVTGEAKKPAPGGGPAIGPARQRSTD